MANWASYFIAWVRKIVEITLRHHLFDFIWQLENVFKCHKALICLAFPLFNTKYQRVFTSITTTYPDAWCVFLWAIWWSSINADKKGHFKNNCGSRKVLLISLLNADCHHYSLDFTMNSFHWWRTGLEVQVVCLILVQGTCELKASIKLRVYLLINNHPRVWFRNKTNISTYSAK